MHRLFGPPNIGKLDITLYSFSSENFEISFQKNIFILNVQNYNSAKFNFTLLADFEDSQLTHSRKNVSPRFNEVNSHQTVKVSKMKYA